MSVLSKTGKKLIYSVAVYIILIGLVNPVKNTPRNQGENDTINEFQKSWVISNGPNGADSISVVVICFDDGFYSQYEYAYPLLKKYGMTATLALVTSKVLEAHRGTASGSRSPYGFMTRHEIQEMIDSLSVEIASHSVSHPRLTELSDTIAIKYELAFSKQILESLFGQEVITFVYPYGKYDDPIIRMVSAAGYKIGRTCDFGEPNFWVAPLKIPIKEVRNTTLVGEIINHIKRHDETVLLFHRIVPKPHSFTDYSVSQFDSLLAVLLRRKVKVVSLRGIYDDWCQKVLQRAILERGLFDKNYWQKYLFQKVDIDQTRTPSRL